MSQMQKFDNGLIDATVFLAFKDDIGVSDGKYLLIGDKEFQELDGKPIRINGVDFPGTEGHTPMILNLRRVSIGRPVTPAFGAAHKAWEMWNHENGRPMQSSGDHLNGSLHVQGESAQASGDMQVVLVAEVTVMIPCLNGSLVGDVIARSIEVVQRLQISTISLGGGIALELLTLEQLPPAVHVVLSGKSNNEPLVQTILVSPHPLSSSKALGVQKFYEEGHAQQILYGMGMAPLMEREIPYFEFRNDAFVQLYRYGNYRQSIVSTSAGAESFLNNILELLMWEEGQTASEAAVVMGGATGILTRCKRHLPGRLKGAWDHTRPGPIKCWSDDILKVRNRIVHAAYAPSRKEAIDALAALDQLVAFIADRFAEDPVRGKYPRSIILSVGQSSLEKRGVWTNQLKSLQENHAHEWRLEFRNWSLALVDELSR